MKVMLLQFTLYNYNSYGILSLSDALTSKGHNVKIIGTRNGLNHLLTEPAHTKRFKKVIKKFEPEIIGFSTMTPDADQIAIFSTYLKQHFPDIPIICGGYHTLIYKEKVLEENDYLDFVFYGEAEEYFHRFLIKLEKGDHNYESIKGLIYRKNGSIIINELPEPYDFNHIIPIRAFNLTSKKIWETYKPEKYVSFTPMFQPNISVLLSRGCPYNCTFCQLFPSNPYSRMRYLLPEKFKLQLEYIMGNYNPRSLFIHDSSFDLNKEWAYEIMQIIEENKKIIEWACYLRPNQVNEEFIVKMKEARCSTALLYLEGGTERIRNNILKKKVTDAEVKRAFSLTKQYGLFTKTNLILGCPTETEEEFRAGIEFLKTLDPDSVSFPLLTIIPGTQLWEEYKDKMIVKRFSDFDVGNTPDNILRDDLKIHFSEIPPKVLVGQKRALNIHFGSFAALSREKIHVKGKSILIIQSGIGNDLLQVVATLFNEFLNYNPKNIDLLLQRNIELDKHIVTSDINRIPIDVIPTDLETNHILWNTLEKNKYNIMIAPINDQTFGLIQKISDIGGRLGVRRVFMMDCKRSILYEFDVKFKSLSQIEIRPHLSALRRDRLMIDKLTQCIQKSQHVLPGFLIRLGKWFVKKIFLNR